MARRSAAACSPSSLTRETDQLEECDQYKVDEDYAEYNAYRRMVEHARTLERERDEWRKKAVDLHARHKGALEDIEAEITERNEWKARYADVVERMEGKLHCVDECKCSGRREVNELRAALQSPENA